MVDYFNVDIDKHKQKLNVSIRFELTLRHSLCPIFHIKQMTFFFRWCQFHNWSSFVLFLFFFFFLCVELLKRKKAKWIDDINLNCSSKKTKWQFDWIGRHWNVFIRRVSIVELIEFDFYSESIFRICNKTHWGNISNCQIPFKFRLCWIVNNYKRLNSLRFVLQSYIKHFYWKSNRWLSSIPKHPRMPFSPEILSTDKSINEENLTKI